VKNILENRKKNACKDSELTIYLWRRHGADRPGKVESGAGTMLNVARLSESLGARVLVEFGNVAVWCVVKDARKVWNRVDLLVAPESGTGNEWVSLLRVYKVAKPAEGSAIDLVKLSS
jgi:hypothetical protein